MSPPTPACPPPLEGAAVSWERCHAGSGRHFFARERAEFWQIREERRGEHGAHPWHTPQHVFFLTPDGTLLLAVS